ncbi:hypothetical protein A2U01_0114595, partial [Trifolium medium]|nr:hypothetical protein [Trifolium medium]
KHLQKLFEFRFPRLATASETWRQKAGKNVPPGEYWRVLASSSILLAARLAQRASTHREGFVAV